jgi:hypothetical protein
MTACREQERGRIEMETRLQSRCEAWYQHRRSRITASTFGKLLYCRGKKETILSYINPKPFTSEAVRWGLRMERLAIRDYELSTGVTVSPIGFLVDPSGKLGATPDGCIREQQKIIEVKAPFTLRHGNALMKAVNGGKFFVKRSRASGEFYLNTSHAQGKRVYAQIQGQLHISQFALTCDLVVWSPSYFLIVSVPKDEVWGKQHLPRLMALWDEYVKVSMPSA